MRASLWQWTRRFLIAAACLAILLMLGAIGIYLEAPVEDLRGTLGYRALREGKRCETGLRSKAFVRLADLPTELAVALVVAEDPNYAVHRGISVSSIRGNLLGFLLTGGSLAGGSTLTQQLMKTIYFGSERTLYRKAREAIYALKLERRFNKQEILELYLNSIEWGPDVCGIREASRYYFDKLPAALSLEESLFLVSIIPSPKRCSRDMARNLELARPTLVLRTLLLFQTLQTSRIVLQGNPQLPIQYVLEAPYELTYDRIRKVPGRLSFSREVIRRSREIVDTLEKRFSHERPSTT